MTDRGRRFFSKVPPGYFEMSQDQQEAAVRELWAAAMTQLGEDPATLVSERATAQDESPARGRERGPPTPVELARGAGGFVHDEGQTR